LAWFEFYVGAVRTIPEGTLIPNHTTAQHGTKPNSKRPKDTMSPNMKTTRRQFIYRYIYICGEKSPALESDFLPKG
jgi:hypothetical protein